MLHNWKFCRIKNVSKAESKTKWLVRTLFLYWAWSFNAIHIKCWKYTGLTGFQSVFCTYGSAEMLQYFCILSQCFFAITTKVKSSFVTTTMQKLMSANSFTFRVNMMEFCSCESVSYDNMSCPEYGTIVPNFGIAILKGFLLLSFLVTCLKCLTFYTWNTVLDFNSSKTLLQILQMKQSEKKEKSYFGQIACNCTSTQRPDGGHM